MPSLKDLATNLPDFKYYSGYGTFKQNALPFGNDRPGNGSSNQPFVVRSIDQRWSPSNFDDGLTKFGAVTLATRTLADLGRISKFLYTTIKGPLFLLKQTGLQRSNPNIDQTNTSLTDRSIIRTQTYNPLGISTLAETAIVGFGQHLTKHGLIPGFDDPKRYQDYILRKDKEGQNRLSNLVSSMTVVGVTNVLKYAGGPNSFIGIGTTTIKRASNFLQTDYIRDDENKSSLKINRGFIYIPHAQLRNISDESTFTLTRAVANDATTSLDITETQFDLRKDDFRKFKNALKNQDFAISNTKYRTLASSDYRKQNVETRIGVARVRPANDRVEYWSSGSDTQDRVNAISLYYSAAPSVKGNNLVDINDNIVNSTNIRDIVKFRIKSFDNDNPTYGVYMIFRAYINSLKRSAVANWESYKYVGRGETFKAYDGFAETINIGFTIAASTRQEMKPLYQKINYLIASMAPDYKNAKARGNIAELTIGDFILYQPGIITNLDVTVDEDTNWEIAINEPDNGPDVSMHELPHILRCNMTFIPIYNFLPRKSSEAPFFGLNNLETTEQGKEAKEWIKGSAGKLDQKWLKDTLKPQQQNNG